jgi:hypothetical protein
MDAVIHVHTFKEGLLSKLAHDLLLNLRRFEIEAQGDAVRAVCESGSLEVLGVVRHDALEESLSEGDKKTILEHLNAEVLRTQRFPLVRFTGRVWRGESALSVEGVVEMCGASQPLDVVLKRDRDRLRGTFELVPSRFGIKPFRALAGTLRVQDRVRITVDACFPGDAPASGPEPLRWRPRD